MNVLGDGALSNYYKVVSIKEYECKDEYIRQALQQLGVFERTCLLLQSEGDFSVEDIADIVDKSQEEVVTALRDAQEHVRQFYYSLIAQEREVQKAPHLESIEDTPDSPLESQSVNTCVDSCPVDQQRIDQIDEIIHGIPTIRPSVPLDALFDFWEEQDRAKAVPDGNVEGKCLSSITERPNDYTVYISYAQRDKEYLDSLKQHLSPLKWQGAISHWYDCEVSAGNVLEQDLTAKLDTASLIILLISPDFMASHSWCDKGLHCPPNMQNSDIMRIIPVFVRAVDWNETFISHKASCSKIAVRETLPTNGKPITSWRNKDEAFLDVVKGIRRVMTEMSLAHTAVCRSIELGAQRLRAANLSYYFLECCRNAVASVYHQQVLADEQREGESKREETCHFSGLSASRESMVPFHDSYFVFSGSDDKTIQIWNAKCSQEIQHFFGCSSEVSSIALFRDRSRRLAEKMRLATCLGEHQELNPPNENALVFPPSHVSDVLTRFLTPNVRFIVFSSDDKTIRLWDATTGDEIRRFVNYDSAVRSIAFSPDGSLVLSSSDDKTVRLWDATTGDEICRLSASPIDQQQITSEPTEEKLVSHNKEHICTHRGENADILDISNEDTWKDLRSTLYPLVLGRIYSTHVPVWRGQEHDLAEDVLQETLMRTITYIRRMDERGEKLGSLTSFKSLMNTIATNYIRDLKRRDMCLVRGSTLPIQIEQWDELVDDSVTQKISEEELFEKIARAMATFPEKQRQALLTDLANRISFAEKPTPLRKAFLEVGIDLHEYQRPLPLNHLEKAQYIALVSLAYQRLASLRLDAMPSIHKPYQSRGVLKLQRKEEKNEENENEDYHPLLYDVKHNNSMAI